MNTNFPGFLSLTNSILPITPVAYRTSDANPKPLFSKIFKNRKYYRLFVFKQKNFYLSLIEIPSE